MSVGGARHAKSHHLNIFKFHQNLNVSVVMMMRTMHAKAVRKKGFSIYLSLFFCCCYIPLLISPLAVYDDAVGRKSISFVIFASGWPPTLYQYCYIERERYFLFYIAVCKRRPLERDGRARLVQQRVSRKNIIITIHIRMDDFRVYRIYFFLFYLKRSHCIHIKSAITYKNKKKARLILSYNIQK